MALTSEIIAWRDPTLKRERGKDGAVSWRLVADQYISEYRVKATEIKKYIAAMSGLGSTMRDTVFDRFNDADLYHRIVRTVDDPTIVEKYKQRMRNCIKSARLLRMQNGNPPALYDYGGTFWSDPSTGYIPTDEHTVAAQKAISFHTLALKMTPVEANRIVSRHQRRGHWGRWTMIERDYDERQRDQVMVYVFLFEHHTDYVEFRLFYDYESTDGNIS